MGHNNPAASRIEFEDLRVFQLLGDHFLRQFKIDPWLAQQKAGYNLLIEIGVGEETDFQA